MECKHYKGSGYHYECGDDEELWLCEDCNMHLAGEIMKQAMIELFVKPVDYGDDEDESLD